MTNTSTGFRGNLCSSERQITPTFLNSSSNQRKKGSKFLVDNLQQESGNQVMGPKDTAVKSLGREVSILLRAHLLQLQK